MTGGTPLKSGMVIRSTGSWFTVRDDEGNRYECRIRGNLRIRGIQTTNPVAVGDRVDFQYLEKESRDQKTLVGVIRHIHERKNYIIRRSQNLSKQAHIIASNIDQAFLVVTLNTRRPPPPSSTGTWPQPKPTGYPSFWFSTKPTSTVRNKWKT